MRPVDPLTRLALAARDGDQQALDAFIRTGQADVYRFYLRLTSTDEAADPAQGTFVRAWRSLGRFRASQKLAHGCSESLGTPSRTTSGATLVGAVCASSHRRIRTIFGTIRALVTTERDVRPPPSSTSSRPTGGKPSCSPN